jgi:hypothetical protein
MFNRLPSFLPLKFILTLSHTLLKHLTPLNKNTPWSPFSSELDNRTHLRDFDASSQLQDLEIGCRGKNEWDRSVREIYAIIETQSFDFCASVSCDRPDPAIGNGATRQTKSIDLCKPDN